MMSADSTKLQHCRVRRKHRMKLTSSHGESIARIKRQADVAKPMSPDLPGRNPAVNHDIPDFSVCIYNTSAISKDSTFAMVAGGPTCGHHLPCLCPPACRGCRAIRRRQTLAPIPLDGELANDIAEKAVGEVGEQPDMMTRQAKEN